MGVGQVEKALFILSGLGLHELIDGTAIGSNIDLAKERRDKERERTD